MIKCVTFGICLSTMCTGVTCHILFKSTLFLYTENVNAPLTVKGSVNASSKETYGFIPGIHISLAIDNMFVCHVSTDIGDNLGCDAMSSWNVPVCTDSGQR